MESLRKGLTAVFTLLLCTPMFVLAIFDDHPCAPGQFKVISKNAESFIRCQTCYMCPPGYGVQKECSETADTVCRRCPEGSFSDSSTRQGGCKQCRPCMDEHDTMQECTPNSDRVCRKTCDPGTFLNVERRRCESCSFCHDKPNVNVSRNAQCENQGLPPMWTCWPNITVATDVSEDEIEVDTDETYSYNTASQQRSEGGFYSGGFGPSLEIFLANYMSTEATTTVPKKKTTQRYDDRDRNSSRTIEVNPSTTNTMPLATSTVPSQAASSSKHQQSSEDVALQRNIRFGVGGIVQSFITYSLVIALAVTVIIQQFKIRTLSKGKTKVIGRQISYEEGVQRNKAWQEGKQSNQEDANVSVELLPIPQTEDREL